MREETALKLKSFGCFGSSKIFFTYADKSYHEIALYFLMQFPTACKYLVEPGPFQGAEEGMKLTFQWFPRQPGVLAGLPLLPSFLQMALQELPESVQHVVHQGE